jgi:hypothetical protein
MNYRRRIRRRFRVSVERTIRRFRGRNRAQAGGAADAVLAGLPLRLRRRAYQVGTGASALVAVALTAFNFTKAIDANANGRTRVRVYVATRRTLLPATRIGPDDIRLTIGRVSRQQLRAVFATTVGLYAVDTLFAGSHIPRACAQRQPYVELDPDAILFTVATTGRLPVTVEPGARVAFSNDTTVLPSNLGNSGVGYVVQWIAGESDSSAELAIALVRSEMAEAKRLGRGRWRIILLSSPAVTTTDSVERLVARSGRYPRQVTFFSAIPDSITCKAVQFRPMAVAKQGTR